MKRRFTLLAIATFLSGTLMAAWDGSTKTAPSSGDGNSESTPYLIESEANLAWLANEVNKGTGNASKFYKQTADLDLGNNPWTPIGNKSKAFSGTYDGNGKVITNLYINAPTTDYIGLFGGIDGATLKNITVASGFVYGKQRTAGICGSAKGNSKILYCTNMATVYGKQEQNAGVVAHIEGTTEVGNCINYGMVSAFNFSGGVVGFCNTGANTTKVYNCVNVGQVFCLRNISGNCYGWNKDLESKTTNCYYDNQINTSEGINGKYDIDYVNDKTGEMEGKSTSELCNGTALSGFTSGANGWEFTAGMYPRLYINKDNPAIILAATPITLKNGDKADNVTQNFTVSTDNDVVWESGNTTYLTISDNNATIHETSGVVLTASKDDGEGHTYTKKVYLKTNKDNSTVTLTIDSETDLKNLRDAVNNYGSYKEYANYDGFKGIHFLLTRDIALSDWTEPIGTHNSFKGIFDGDGYTISGINIAQTSYSSVGGIFGCASCGEIKNLTVLGSVSGNDLIGGICGATFNEKITNCVSYCELSCNGKSQVGGITGDDRGYSTFTNCSNYGTIVCGPRSGGIVGRGQMYTIIDGCKNYGNITANADNIGGICGSIATSFGGGEISNCENYGTLTIDNKTNIGGILGYIPGTATDNVVINNCLNISVITVNGNDAKHIGGIVGQSGATLTLSNCLNTGEIIGNEQCGGIVGLSNEVSHTTITNCFNGGKISGGGIVGGLDGDSSCSNSINIGNATSSASCFFDKQMCPVSGNNGKLTSAMLGESLKSSLDNDAWTFTEGMYPRLKSFESSKYMIVAATPLILAADDKIGDVKKMFHIGTGNSVQWSCNNPEVIDISGSEARLYRPDTDSDITLTVMLGSNETGYATKSIPLAIKAKGTLVDPEIDWDWTGRATTYNTDLTLSDDLKDATMGDECHGTFEYNFNNGDILGAGQHSLTATYKPTDYEATYYNEKVISVDITIKATPTITWDNPGSIVYGTLLSSTQLNASVNVDASIGSISYSENGLPIAVGDLLSADNHIITATFTPNAQNEGNYNSISTTATIVVSQATPTITWNTPADITYGTELSGSQLNAQANVSGSYTYSPAEGTKLEAGDNQTLGVTFVPTDTKNYTTATASVTINVAQAEPTITWSNPSDITYGDLLSKTTQLNASAGGIEGSFAYTLENGSNAEGVKLDAGDNQKIYVTFSPDQNDAIAKNYKSNTAEVSINVAKATPAITWSNPSDITYGTPLSETQLNASTDGIKGSYEYTLEGGVNANGAKLDAGDNQKLYVSFLPDQNDAVAKNYESNTAEVSINVNKATPVISWTPEDYTYGDSEDMINTKIKNASASFNGANVLGEFAYVLPKKPGSEQQAVTLTFTPTDAANFNSVNNESRNIYFNKKTPVVTWDNLDGITYGTALTKQQQLNADISNNTDIVGKVKYTLANGDDAMNAILDAGTHEITATLAESAYYEKWEMTQTITVTQVEPIIEWTPNAVAWGASEEEIESNVKNAVAKDAKGNVLEGEFAYTIPELTAAGEVEVSVTFENKNYKTAAATTKTLNVTKAYPVIAWTPQNITFGASSDEIVSKIDNAQASYNGEEVKGAFEYDTNIPNLNAGTHVVTVKFTPQDGEKFNDVEETAELTIEKATPTIVWEPQNVTYGASSEEIAAALENADAQFNGETVSGDYEYILPLTTDLQVGLEEMDLIAVVTFTPTGDDTTNFEAASAFVNVVVEKATPVITWNTPEDITVGTALSAAQLNATANVEGNFAYTPAADAVLEVGEHQKLSVVFTPTDAVNYNSASDSVFINVKAASADTTQIDSTAAIVWAPSAIVYGTPVGETFNATTKVEGEITYSLAADSILNAGEYKVTAKLSAVNGNDTTIERIVKVTKAELTATVANDTIVQGDTMPTFEINYAGFVGNDNATSLTTAPTATCSASTDSVGSFEIVISGGEAINYDFIHVNGLLTILAKGDTLQPIDTVQPIDTTGVAIITWAPAVSTITYGTLIDSTILNATANVEGTFIYSAIKVEFTEGDTTSIVYALGDSVINDTIIVEPNTTYTTRSLAIGDTLNAGTYKLIATFVPVNNTLTQNEPFITDTVKLTVNKATLTVSVADVTIKQFDEIPASFEITYEGFVLGQNENNLTWIPKAKEQVSNADETGTFDIILLGGQSDNYEFDYHHGKLTILKQDDDVAINESAAIFEVYPNPSNGTFFVNAGDVAQEVRIFNSTGKLVKVETIDGVTRIDISEYANGMYFVKVGNQTKTIIKQ